MTVSGFLIFANPVGEKWYLAAVLISRRGWVFFDGFIDDSSLLLCQLTVPVLWIFFYWAVSCVSVRKWIQLQVREKQIKVVLNNIQRSIFLSSIKKSRGGQSITGISPISVSDDCRFSYATQKSCACVFSWSQDSCKSTSHHNLLLIRRHWEGQGAQHVPCMQGLRTSPISHNQPSYWEY